MPWLVLRPQPDADRLVAALRARGVEAHATPAIEMIAVPLPRAVGLAISTARGAARSVLLMVTSARAAERAAATDELRGLPVAALTPTSAGAARDLGLDVVLTSSGGALELAMAVGAYARAQPGGRPVVLHGTSDAALAQDEDAAIARALEGAAELVRFPLYETRAHPALASSLAALALPRARYVATSPSTVDALAAVPHPSAEVALCRGRTTVDAWKSRFPAGPAPVLIDRERSLEDAIAAYAVNPEVM